MRTAYLGDAVMTLPMLRPLKERFRDAKITFLASRASCALIKGNPYVDELISYEPFWFYPKGKGDYMEFMQKMGRRSFDMVIEARGDVREILLLAWRIKARFRVSYDVGGGGYLLTHVVPYPGLKHKVQYHLDIARYLGASVDGVYWGVYLADEEKAGVDALLRARGVAGPFVAAHPGTRLPLKRWKVERYAALYDGIVREKGMPLVLLGMKSERALVEDIMGRMKERAVNLAGETGVRELAGVLGRASMFICNDSGPMHIAAAMGTPTVAIFGPSKSVETGPYGEVHRVVEKYLPCRPSCDESTCHYSRYHACMEDIEVVDVMRAVEELMEERAHVQA
jgi:ADP-heptose:LPS heptosyltransferase